MDRARELRQEKDKPTPPSPERQHALDRSTSTRNAPTSSSSSSPAPKKSLDRSTSQQRDPNLSSSQSSRTPTKPSTGDSGPTPLVIRPAPPKPSTSALEAGPRRREPKNKGKDGDIVERLKAICTDADPTKLYRNLVKIGQG